MSHNYYLSVAGVKILLESDNPLTVNEEFLPFLMEPTTADLHAVIRRTNDMPRIPSKPIYADIFCTVTQDEAGNIQKFFFSSADGSYIVSTYYADGASILIEYPSDYQIGILDLQNCFYCLGFEEYLLRRNKLCLHASCIDTALGGILFSGPSGIGKSTQAELWRKHRQARPINGDRPIVSKEDQTWLAWGSPYAGSSKVYVNDSCTVTSIILLKQASTCALRKLSHAEAFHGIWTGLTVRTWDRSFVEAASSLAIELVSTVPVYEFCCTPDEKAVKFLEAELRKEYKL